VTVSEYSAPYTRANVDNWRKYYIYIYISLSRSLFPSHLSHPYPTSPSLSLYLPFSLPSETLLSPRVNETSTDQFGYQTVFYLYRVGTLLDSLESATSVYYNLENITVGNYEYFYNEPEHEREPISLSIERYKMGQNIFDLDIPFDDATVTSQYSLQHDGDLGPFNALIANGSVAVKEYVEVVRSMSLSFHVKNYNLDGFRTCNEWEVEMYFDMSIRGRTALKIEMGQKLCPRVAGIAWYEREHPLAISMYFCVLFFSLVYWALHIKALARSIQLYQEIRDKAGRTQHWGNLSCSDKLKFFNLWFIIATIGSVSNILASSFNISNLFSLEDETSFRVYFTGTGALLTYVNMVQYFESTTSFYVLITTLKRGAPRVARFLVGVMPVFLGYSLFGVAFFASTSIRFASLDLASVTLFSLLNGDVIHDVFDELHPSHPIMSRVYLYTFISLFIYAVLNIFVAIIEDAFFASKAFQEQQQREAKTLNLEKVDPLVLVDSTIPPVNTPMIGRRKPEMRGTRESSMDEGRPILTPSGSPRVPAGSPLITSSSQSPSLATYILSRQKNKPKMKLKGYVW